MKLLVKSKDLLDHTQVQEGSTKVHEDDDLVESWPQESPKAINADCNISSKSQDSGDLAISSDLSPSVFNLEKVTILEILAGCCFLLSFGLDAVM
ncbi:hypothetical protein V6N11_076720 [Hibiscus sabdariffa]|uniref:Uncharacterized protein n=2 Tax=Hibiscus sabdariffa TaxID=183260 RepID=A0ABR1ZDS9_9ROSI